MNKLIGTLQTTGGALLDRFSEWTGYAALPVPLQRASRSGEVTLDLPGYRQMNTYCCGAVAAAMAVRFLRPKVSFERVHAAVDPSPQYGAGTSRVTRALRSLSIGVERRKNLTFSAICKAIDAEKPVLVRVKTNNPQIAHWVCIYGYGWRPNIVFLAGQGLPFLGQQQVTWQQFVKQWTPVGEGLLCGKSNRRKFRVPHTSKE